MSSAVCAVGGAAPNSGGRSSTSMRSDRASATARSNAFSNSRTLPGHVYRSSGFAASGDDLLVKELAGDEAIKAADTLLLTIPNQLGVDYNAHLLESILNHVAPELGWR
jgi:hypothetical protein